MGSTLLTIRNRVRNNLGEITASAYTNAEINQYINEAYQKYTIFMIDEGDGYFETTGDISLVANQDTYNLVSLFSTFFRVSDIRKVTSYGTVPLKWSEKRFVPIYTTGVGSGDLYLPECKMVGNLLTLQPGPQASETNGIRIWYNYQPALPTADADTYDNNFPTFFEPIIDLYATIACLEAKDAMGGVADIQSFRRRLDQWEKMLQNSLERTEYPDSVQYIGTNYNLIF